MNWVTKLSDVMKIYNPKTSFTRKFEIRNSDSITKRLVVSRDKRHRADMYL